MFIKSPFCIENRGAFPIHFTVNIGPQFPRWRNIPSSQVTHTHRDIDRDTAILYYITLHYIVTSPDFPWFSMICHDFPLIFPCIFFFQTPPPDLRRIGVAAPGGAVAAPGSQQGSCWLLNGCWWLNGWTLEHIQHIYYTLVYFEWCLNDVGHFIYSLVHCIF